MKRVLVSVALGALLLGGCSSNATPTPDGSTAPTAVSFSEPLVSSEPSVPLASQGPTPPEWSSDIFSQLSGEWEYTYTDNRAMALRYEYLDQDMKAFVAKLQEQGWLFDVEPQELDQDGVKTYATSLYKGNDSISIVATSSGVELEDGGDGPITAVSYVLSSYYATATPSPTPES